LKSLGTDERLRGNKEEYKEKGHTERGLLLFH
jgi:hypothetical protein